MTPAPEISPSWLDVYNSFLDSAKSKLQEKFYPLMERRPALRPKLTFRYLENVLELFE